MSMLQKGHLIDERVIWNVNNGKVCETRKNYAKMSCFRTFRCQSSQYTHFCKFTPIQDEVKRNHLEVLGNANA